MSRQFFIQFKRHFYISAGVKRMCHSSVFRAALTPIGSGSQVPRMGTSKSARRRELASAGAGFLHSMGNPGSAKDASVMRVAGDTTNRYNGNI